ncbi:MAG: orotidine-5'-phosphate decarboxylase [Actinobacteria bacterium]|nr:orotidine-5'-phosphate decarboxylase [Actinomycetota bacterium]
MLEDEGCGISQPRQADVSGGARGDAAKDKLIVALDTADAGKALELARRLRGLLGWVKVGMTLYYAEGPQIVRELRSLGFKVFVDLKLNDIPHQVDGACRTLTRIGADMFTVHAGGGRAMLEAAMAATAVAAQKVRATPPKVVAVTVLTSLDDAALGEIGIGRTTAEQVEVLATLARDAGCDGVVCSPNEASVMRELLGADALVVTPGIRPTGEAAGDQARTATPAEALAAGASHLVVGRPVTGAESPVEAAKAILKEMSS